MTVPPRLLPFTKPVQVLDHGYVMLTDVMGDDNAIIQAARVSYAKGVGARKSSTDRHLLRYMLRNGHTSPFEQCVIKLEVKLPIFVERQWVRHRTGRHNEMSARYSQLPNEFYLPGKNDIRAQSATNKQGRGEPLSESTQEENRDSLRSSYEESYKRYEEALASGVTREIARLHLPVAIYTAKVWQMDLHNLFHFLSLRLDSHAQQEIRAYAQAIAKIVKVWVPWAWEAFEDYRLKAMYLTGADVQAVRYILERLTSEGYQTEALIRGGVGAAGVQGRERDELISKLERLLLPETEEK